MISEIVTMPWLLYVVVFLAIGRTLHYVYKRRLPKLDLPVMGSPGEKDFLSALIEGYRKYPDSAFVIPTARPRVILPMKLLNEVVYAPPEKISFSEEVYDNMLGKHTGTGVLRKELADAIRFDLTKSIGNIMPLIQEEARYGLTSVFGQPDEWTPIPFYSKLLRVVALLTGRVFVGLPLSRDEEWISMSIEYTETLVNVMTVASKWHPLIRPILGAFLPEVRKVQSYVNKAERFMKPLLREALSSQDDEEATPVKVGARGAFILWMLKYLPDNLRTAKRIGGNQMLATFASIHATCMTTTNVVLDLIARPEYISLLREELDQVMREDGLIENLDLSPGNGPIFPKSSIAKLRRLDSFIKESQRFSPNRFVNTTRRLMVPYTFSNGLSLPAGTAIGFPMQGVHMGPDTTVFSPEYNLPAGNPGPEIFDGLRFARLRDVPGREAKHQAATTGPESLNFGHGPYACPGRFFAIHEVKTLVIELLRGYEMRLVGDVEGQGGVEKRPKTVVTLLQTQPNLDAVVELRRRRVGGGQKG